MNKVRSLHHVLPCFLCFVCTMHINAQIKGIVVDDNNLPIESATIQILNRDSTLMAGGSTNYKGEFEISVTPVDSCFLLVSCVGYDSKKLLLHNIQGVVNIGTLKLESKLEQLNEVTVTAKSQLSQIDKTLIFPSELNKKHASDGFKLLNNLMIPQIDVDLLKKSVTRRGKSVLLAINGRPINNSDEINMMNPQDILRVEYHETPTGFFAGNEAVIDFIIRQYEFGGYLGINGTQHFSYVAGDYMAMVRVNHKKTELSLGYSYGYLKDKNINKNVDEMFLFPDVELRRTENTEDMDSSVQRNKIHQVFFNYYLINKSNRFNLQLGYKENAIPDNILQSRQFYSGKYNFIRNLRDVTTESSKQPYVSFYTSQQFKNEQSLYAAFNLSHSRNNYSRYYEELDENNISNLISSDVNENFINIMTTGYYTKSFKKGNSMDIQFADFYKLTESNYRGIFTSKEKLFTNEVLIFFYLNKQWGKLYTSFRIGGSHIQYKQSDTYKKTYTSFRPSLIIKYKLNEQNSIQYRGYWDNSFPTLSLLTDVEQSIDFLQKRKGNPNLKIMKLLSNRLTYSHISEIFNAELSLEHYNYFPTIKNSVSYSGSYFIHSYESDGTYSQLSPGIGLTLKLFENKLNFKLNAGFNYYQVTGTNKNDRMNWYLNPSIQYFYKDFSLNAFYSSPKKGLSNSLNFWNYSERYGLSASYNKNNLSFTVGTQNPFSIYKTEICKIFDKYTSRNVTYNSQYDHLLYVQFKYTFTTGRKYTYSNINSNQNLNTAILKGSKD